MTEKNDIIKSEKSDDTSNFIDRYFHEPIAIVFSHIFIKLGIVPNAITIMSGISGAIGGYFIYLNDTRSNIIGILLEVLAVILDTSDGQVARLTNHCSRFGRLLDGICDAICFVSIYLALSLRLMSETIPFTDIRWNYYIWAVAVASALCHQNQSAMADYYKNIHLFFINTHHDLDRSEKIKEDINSQKGFSLRKICLKSYYSYTLKQEKNSPNMQALLRRNEECELNSDAKEFFVVQSRKYIFLQNLLSVTPKAIILYLLILAKQYAFFFPCIIVVFGIINQTMIRKYEKIARETLARV